MPRHALHAFFLPSLLLPWAVVSGATASSQIAPRAGADGPRPATLVVESVSLPSRVTSVRELAAVAALPGIRAFSAAGDVNGDGFSDVLIGVPGNNEVVIYGGDADGILNFQTLLTSSQPGSEFGAAVSSAGDVNADGYDDVIVGEPLFRNLSAQVVGRVSIFHGSGSGLSTTPALQIEGPVDGGRFGAAVARGGNLNRDAYDDVAVGAPEAVVGLSLEAGIVHVYSGGPGGLNATPLVLTPGMAGERVGASLAGVGDVDGDGDDDLVVGAPRSALSPGPGRVYLYQGEPGSMGATPAQFVTDPESGSLYGFAVAPAGDFNGDGYADAVVGAPNDDTPSGGADAGAVHLLPGGPAGLGAPTIREGTQAGAHLGQAVGCAGDVNGDGLGDFVVGEPDYDGLAGLDEGRATIVYGRRVSDALAPANRIVAGQAPGSRVGFMVGGFGDLGAEGFSDVGIGEIAGSDGQLNYLRGGVAAAARISSVLFGPGNGAGGAGPLEMGAAVATGGDVNGDGLDDVIIGAPRDDAAIPNEGVAYVQHGVAANGSLISSATTLAGGQSNSRFGSAVAIAGDVDGDGYDDALVGAPDYNAGAGGEGRAFLFRGSAGGVLTMPLWTSTGAPGQHWASAVSTAGDMNRDGHADIAVASHRDGTNGAAAGRVAIHLGGPGGPAASPSFEVFGDVAGDSLGFALAAAGDVNGDGYDDLVIGAPGDSLATGGAFLVYGAASPPYAVFKFGTSFQPGAGYGRAVAGRGDVDGDGFADVAVGAPRNTYSISNSGSVRVYRGGPGGISTTVSSGIGGELPFDFFGAAVSFGDLSGDGLSDLCIGAPGADSVTSNLGAVYAFIAAGDGSFAAPASSKLIQTTSTRLGRGASLAANGDFNGDGFADVVFGMPQSTFGAGGLVGTAAGGGVLHARERIERMRKADDSAPIALQGAATDANLRLRARTAVGRQLMFVQHQAGPVGTPFASLPILLSVEAGPGAPDPDLGVSLDVGQLLDFPAGTSVKWRMRVKTRFPWTPYTPWLTPSANAATLADLLIPGGTVAVGPGEWVAGHEGPGLAPPSPNPSRVTVNLAFALPRAADVVIAIHDARGRLVRELARGPWPAGPSQLTWDGADARGRAAGAGVYFARVTTSGGSAMRRLVRLE